MGYSLLLMLDFQKIKAISIDLDDTLWPIGPTIANAEKALEGWLSEHAPMTAALFSNATAHRDIREQIRRSRPELKHDLSAIRLEAIRLALGHAGENTALAEAAFEVFFAARQKVTLFDDALPALQFLAARYSLVAVSNGNADVNRIGLGAYFVASIRAQEFGVGKPDPRIFHAAAGAVDALPEQMLHVGDDAALDVLGALNCGMQAVWVNREDQLWAYELQPHETVDSLTELTGLIAV